MNVETLVGMQIQDATRRATESGFVVKVEQAGLPVQLMNDFQINRVVLQISQDGTVTSARNA